MARPSVLEPISASGLSVMRKKYRTWSPSGSVVGFTSRRGVAVETTVSRAGLFGVANVGED